MNNQSTRHRRMHCKHELFTRNGVQSRRNGIPSDAYRAPTNRAMCTRFEQGQHLRSFHDLFVDEAMFRDRMIALFTTYLATTTIRDFSLQTQNFSLLEFVVNILYVSLF